jgi:hypothetical protein
MFRKTLAALAVFGALSALAPVASAAPGSHRFARHVAAKHVSAKHRLIHPSSWCGRC